MKVIIRWLGIWFFAGALIALALDGMQSLANQAVTMTPLGELWYRLDPASLNTAQAAVQRHLSPELWDPVILSVLKLPVWAIAGAVAILLILLGRPRKRYDPLSDRAKT
ncbi:MAG: hypothetical protein MI753_06075 [Hyphomicrobiales bacterium]|nr:hypothetical protein [Hyphomicrobiales bacterium]